MVIEVLHPKRLFARISHQASRDTGHGHAAHGEGAHGHEESAIDKYKKLTKQAKIMVRAMNRHHRQAYDTMLEEVLGDDLEKLEDEATAVTAAKKMSDIYLSRAKTAFKISPDQKLDELEQTLLLNAYGGATEKQLTKLMKRHGKDFTDDFYLEKVKPELIKQVTESLYSAAASHFKDEHIPDIIGYTKSKDFIDPEKVRLGEAVEILARYETAGAVLPKEHEKAIYYKKKDHGHAAHGGGHGH